LTSEPAIGDSSNALDVNLSPPTSSISPSNLFVFVRIGCTVASRANVDTSALKSSGLVTAMLLTLTILTSEPAIGASSSALDVNLSPPTSSINPSSLVVSVRIDCVVASRANGARSVVDAGSAGRLSVLVLIVCTVASRANGARSVVDAGSAGRLSVLVLIVCTVASRANGARSVVDAGSAGRLSVLVLIVCTVASRANVDTSALKSSGLVTAMLLMLMTLTSVSEGDSSSALDVNLSPPIFHGRVLLRFRLCSLLQILQLLLVNL
jgi:hypothetical protein